MQSNLGLSILLLVMLVHEEILRQDLRSGIILNQPCLSTKSVKCPLTLSLFLCDHQDKLQLTFFWGNGFPIYDARNASRL